MATSIALATCKSAVAGEGCGRNFPFKTAPNLCAKCDKLLQLAEGTSEYISWKNIPQCAGCGVGWRNLQQRYCGLCEERLQNDPRATSSMQSPPTPQAQALGPSAVSMPPPSIAASQGPAIVPPAAEGASSRAHALSARLHRQPLSFAVPVIPSTAPHHTTAGLAAAKAAVMPDENKVLIEITKCRVKAGTTKDANSTSIDCGTWAKPWKRSEFLSDVLEHALTMLNPNWSETHGMSLTNNEVEFRFTGNKIFAPGTRHSTVGELYDAYVNGDYSWYRSDAPSQTQKKAKKLGLRYHLKLELYIDKQKFLIRRNRETSGALSAIDSSIPGNRKRSATTTSLGGSSASKRTMGYLQSSFIPTPVQRSAGATQKCVEISFIRARTTCDPATGLVDIMWPVGAEPETGLLCIDVFAAGATKKVHQLTIGTDLFVAKRYVEIGGVPTADENREEVTKELVRLKNNEWFLLEYGWLWMANACRGHECEQ